MNRRISLEKDFMDWRKDDIMYAYLLNLAEYRKQDNLLWLDKTVYYSARDEIMAACDYVNRMSLRNNMKKWLESGLITEGIVKHRNKECDAYIFKNYDKDGKYQLVNLEILRKLIDAKNKHSIQVYTYLLNKYKFKKNYEFSLKELRENLGYISSSETRTNRRLTNIIQDLQHSGYIDYEPETKIVKLEDGKVVYIPINILTFVAKEPKDFAEWKPVN